MEQAGPIQWFPGHMAKTRRKITESLPLVDLVIEVIDARVPVSSRNPELDELIADKPRLLVLNKADLADEAATRLWVAAFERQGLPALAADCKSGRGLGQIVPQMRRILAPQIAAWEKKGMVGRPLHAMVVGIPNAGKSSFINRLAKGGRAKTEDRPGVTRGNQWFSVENGVLLLDTPGVLWPKFDDPQVGWHLAFTGAIRDQILDVEELAAELLRVLAKDYPARLRERYKLPGEPTDPLPEDGWELLGRIGKKRGMLVSGGEVDTERAARMVLDEYRAGRLGRITVERPTNEGEHA